MSSPSKKRRKSFLDKLRRVFKKRGDDERTSGSLRGRRKSLDDDRQSASQNCADGGKFASRAAEPRETRATAAARSDRPSGEERDDNKAQGGKDVTVARRNEDVVGGDRNGAERVKYNGREITAVAPGSDRHMSTKITFLKQSNDDAGVLGSESRPGDADNAVRKAEADVGSGPKSAVSRSPPANGVFPRKLVAKETKAIFQESSEDSDFSADSTEDSFEESSEDENERLIESERAHRYFKDEYFTKGKYITYFFLEMERQFYDPTEVYSMVQYHSTDCEKPRKEGTKNDIHNEKSYIYIRCFRFDSYFFFCASVFAFVSLLRMGFPLNFPPLGVSAL